MVKVNWVFIIFASAALTIVFPLGFFIYKGDGYYNTQYNFTTLTVYGYNVAQSPCQFCYQNNPNNQMGPSCFEYPYTATALVKYEAWLINKTITIYSETSGYCGSTYLKALSGIQYLYWLNKRFKGWYKISDPKVWTTLVTYLPILWVAMIIGIAGTILLFIFAFTCHWKDPPKSPEEKPLISFSEKNQISEN
jgi:hypothetical protein